ncbi:hypothetical protein [Vagococcus acidifermentans]|uniref:Uncharacterized protein n=1 Tax=Vagococcus acidifermentans TaxID=564710 RepID=A0A430ALF5_9ENTE|nr:hypothetical protein [Vagococcus acidifermentans]RSU08938.1 hypothetical protein CBF27_13850 [Vagococcus acidifermentans]
MAKEKDIIKELKTLGYDPIPNSCILVRYGDGQDGVLSKVLKVLRNGVTPDQLLFLQICANELVLVPLGWKKLIDSEQLIEIPLEVIQTVSVKSDGINYRITIKTADDWIALNAPKPEFEFFRGKTFVFAQEDFFGQKNWHVDNFQKTLRALEELPRKKNI